MRKNIVIATRGSELALWQANFIKAQIEAKHSDVHCELNVIKTMGDKILDVPLAKIGGKGLFVKEIETALLERTADIAVHSMKDVPMELPEGLKLVSSPKAGSSHDALVSTRFNTIEELPINAKVGTSSLRRKLQLLELRPDLEVLDLRGNLQTRLRKLDEAMYDAIILAEAGLVRLGLEDRVKESIDVEKMLPPSCQGILGLETRSDDVEMIELLKFINDEDTDIRVRAERKFLFELKGGCQVPIACYSTLDKEKGTIAIRGKLYTLDGRIKIDKNLVGSIERPEEIGKKLADAIISDGGDKILKEIYV